jgi:tetratricopeptide (TPR) repeat protein
LIVVAVLSVAVARVEAAESCGALESRLEAQVAGLQMVADQVGELRAIGDAALEGVKACPQSERLWYLAARSAEVLEGSSGGAAFPEAGSARKIAQQAAAHVPRSAAVATVLARVDQTEQSARMAYDLDPHYAPARRALALALARKGSFDDARKLVTPAAGAADLTARARVLLAAGKPGEAAAEAQKALKRPRPDAAELSPTTEILREANEVLGFALLAQGRTREALRALHVAASTGSLAAQAELAKRREPG